MLLSDPHTPEKQPENVPETLLIFHQMPARLRARGAAVCEALCLLRDFAPKALAGGPLSEHKGVFWITVRAERPTALAGRLARLGYASAVDVLAPIPEADWRRSTPGLVRWRKQPYRVERLYTGDLALLRETAPDRRIFLLETAAGEVRSVRGYRGDGGALSRRALPVVDARLLVNLVWNGEGGRFLDPFAGAGGIVYEAQQAGWRALSGDIDPALRFGLGAMSAAHTVLDAQHLPLAANTLQAIASEPPYERHTMPLVAAVLGECARVLVTSGRIALLCARWQTTELRQRGRQLGLVNYLDYDINRKGTDCTVLAWEKPQ